MRLHSLSPLFSLSFLLTGTVAGAHLQDADHHGPDPVTTTMTSPATGVVTVVVRNTVTTCPFAPPPPCATGSPGGVASSGLSNPASNSGSGTASEPHTVSSASESLVHSSTVTVSISSSLSTTSDSSTSTGGSSSSNGEYSTPTDSSAIPSSVPTSYSESCSTTESSTALGSTIISSTLSGQPSHTPGPSSSIPASESDDGSSTVPSNSQSGDVSSTSVSVSSAYTTDISITEASSSTGISVSEASSVTDISSSAGSSSTGVSSSTVITSRDESSSTVVSSTASASDVSSDVSSTQGSSTGISSIEISSSVATSSTYPSSTTAASSTTPVSSTDASTTEASSTQVSSTLISSSTTTTSTTSTSATAPACTDYWLSKVTHQGVAPYAASGYKVFRNVKDYGAKGDGVTDDTEAINLAISDGNRCGPGCTGSTKTPALVYFPPGTYLVSEPIVDYYYTQVIGNPSCMPVIKASQDFVGPWVFDGNQYGANGLAWGATNVFWRQIANIEIDTTAVPANREIAALHWPTSQATSLANMVFRLSEATGTKHQGLFIEEGSGGYMGDLVFYGGARALSVGNQQFTMRNLTIHRAHTAISQLWSWGWTYKGVSINNCQVGFDFTAASDEGNLNVGSIAILDSEIKNTPIGITYGKAGATTPALANTFVFENLDLDNVPVAIQSPEGTVLAGSTGKSTIAAWGRGNSYTSTSTAPEFIEGPITPNTRPEDLVAGTHFYERSKPLYADVPASEFISARDAGAKGDGETDDTNILNALIAGATASGKIVFLDYGLYVVTGTIHIPAGARIVGEAFPIILSSGSFFADAKDPQPVVQVGYPGELGAIEWSDVIVSTRGAQAGAIGIEYNLASPSSAPSGMWDVHVRIGGFAGSDLQLAECAKTPNTTITEDNYDEKCVAAFMSMHITKHASGLLMENCWLWVADHDLEEGAHNQQITIYAGRGLLIESQAGSIWLYGTGVEHHQLYEYQLVGTRGVVMGQIQTETAYYQPNPDATIPFASLRKYHDPVFDEGESGWGLRIVDSSDVLVYGAGLYSFFDNYDVNCSQIGQGATCQRRTFSVEDCMEGSVSVYGLNTVGTNQMITVDGEDIAHYADNIDGFAHSIALFRN